MSCILNVGLNTNGGRTITPEQAKQAVTRFGIVVEHAEVKQSTTEPTLVMYTSRPLWYLEALCVCWQLEQECLAQMYNGVGELLGPQADKWGEFNPDYFLM